MSIGWLIWLWLGCLSLFFVLAEVHNKPAPSFGVGAVGYLFITVFAPLCLLAFFINKHVSRATGDKQ